ncbi:MAG: carbamoyltransferase [Gammaproteobacteria bacterium]
MNRLLGLSAYYHDAAAALLEDGQIVAAVQEERFSRRKHDFRFPSRSIRWCLESRGLSLTDLDGVVFYDKPLLKFERLLETYLAFAPRGLKSFITAMPVWVKEKLLLKSTLRGELAELAGCSKKSLPDLMFASHHESHAASAFFPSPFDDAAVLCLDGVGEWATGSAWTGEGSALTPVWQLDFPHSLGLLYSAFTYFCGFRVNSGEYKLMGLAPYGQPRYRDLILERLVDVKADGSLRLDLDYFDYCTGFRMTHRRFAELFGGAERKPESPITQREMDLAASIQAVTEEIVLAMARSLHERTGKSRLCMAGGVALNCVANGRLLREGPFEDIWIQPAAGDAGGAVGSALAAWHLGMGKPRGVRDAGGDDMRGAYLGPSWSLDEAKAALDAVGAAYEVLPDEALLPRVAALLARGKVVGWFTGPMEFGPRALGGRSILGDPRDADMQSRMNLKIKFREGFRPFAPAVLAERASDWFDLDAPSPYMLLVAQVAAAKRLAPDGEDAALTGLDRLKARVSVIPAVTHVDGSARIQTVDGRWNPRYRALLEAFEAATGCPVLVNTSFNVRGEPIVCSPEDAWRCFMRTGMDYLVVDNCLLEKSRQPQWEEAPDWRDALETD